LVIERVFGTCEFVIASYAETVGAGPAVIVQQIPANAVFAGDFGSLVEVIGDSTCGAIIVQDADGDQIEVPKDGRAI
jgi:hypothetical protein